MRSHVCVLICAPRGSGRLLVVAVSCHAALHAAARRSSPTVYSGPKPTSVCTRPARPRSAVAVAGKVSAFARSTASSLSFLSSAAVLSGASLLVLASPISKAMRLPSVLGALPGSNKMVAACALFETRFEASSKDSLCLFSFGSRTDTKLPQCVKQERRCLGVLGSRPSVAASKRRFANPTSCAALNFEARHVRPTPPPGAVAPHRKENLMWAMTAKHELPSIDELLRRESPSPASKPCAQHGRIHPKRATPRCRTARVQSHARRARPPIAAGVPPGAPWIPRADFFSKCNLPDAISGQSVWAGVAFCLASQITRGKCKKWNPACKRAHAGATATQRARRAHDAPGEPPPPPPPWT